jgi:hypothetical protein
MCTLEFGLFIVLQVETVDCDAADITKRGEFHTDALALCV